MVSREEFIRVWQRAETFQEVLDKTGLKRTTASERASRYRRNGVPLKSFHRSRPPKWDELADYARWCATDEPLFEEEKKA